MVLWDTNTGKMALVDVKTVFNLPYNKDGSPAYAGNQPKLRDDGVWQVLYVFGESSPRLPVGLWEALGRPSMVEE
jgi:hypothetical protein